ncbi:MAG: 3-dehydroquinate synthase, partial [Halofilum sp. (in: g-proteobacteria)]
RYPIRIGRGILDESSLAEWLEGDSVIVVTNETIAPLWLERVHSAVGRGYRIHDCVLPDGERFKNLEVLQRVLDTAVDNQCDRQSTIVALGGGVVGDMAGFAAAIYQRGIPFIQVPTTLLAQVDSSVGGKTGVNHPRGKNMIGAFHQPRCVMADTATLDTLDDRQLRAGLAEVIKYGLIADSPFFEWIEGAVESLLARDPVALRYAIEQSCRNKATIVAADEYEQDRRALLNLGHTFGHAIETATGYDTWLHGEAIAAGMCMAARMSERLGMLTTAARERTEALFRATGLPTVPPAIDGARMLELMAGDKKARRGRIRLVLMDAIGAARVVDDYAPEALAVELGMPSGAQVPKA